MTKLFITTAAAIALSTAAFAKTHDQGVADGTPGSEINVPGVGNLIPGALSGLVDNVVRAGLEGTLAGEAPVAGENANADSRRSAKGANGKKVGQK